MWSRRARCEQALRVTAPTFVNPALVITRPFLIVTLRHRRIVGYRLMLSVCLLVDLFVYVSVSKFFRVVNHRVS